jgi:cytochrome c peroxidase
MRFSASIGLTALLLTAGCDQTKEQYEIRTSIQGTEFTSEQLEEILALSPVPPTPKNPHNQYADHAGAALLGQHLFFETRLSINNQVSCATCHAPEKDWTDGKVVSEGLEAVTRNSPTLFNLAHNRWFFWDGRKDSLWAQSLGPIENKKEMGGSRIAAYHLIAEDKSLRAAYEDVFGAIPVLESDQVLRSGFPTPKSMAGPDNIAWNKLNRNDQSVINTLFANIGKSIEAFERLIVSKESPFDHFVAELRTGQKENHSSLTKSAVRGLKLFIDRGQCTFCHAGPNLTDLEFHNIGLDRGVIGLDTGRFDAVKKVKRDPFNGLGAFSDSKSMEANKSLFFLAQKPNNLGEFKTPTLRNIARTAPYMHDGRFETLRDVIHFYSELDQTPALGHREETLQPLALTEEETDDLIEFLESLTGKPLDPRLLTKPSSL